MLFTKNNPPPGYYVYLYLRDDGTPYYVGKGKGNRAWVSHRFRYKKSGWVCGVHRPKDPSRILILYWDLTDIWSFIEERRLIVWFGRKDIKTGILHNRTNGGPGTNGIAMTQRHCKSSSNSLKGKSKTLSHAKNISVGLTGRKLSTQHKINVGIASSNRSQEANDQISASNSRGSVQEISSGLTFTSTRRAAAHFGIHFNTVKSSINTGNEIKVGIGKGLKFRFV